MSPEERPGAPRAIGPGFARLPGPPLALDEVVQPLIDRLRGHVRAQDPRSRTLPGAVVRKVPPRERLHRRMREKHGVKLRHVFGLVLLPVRRGFGPLGHRPFAELGAKPTEMCRLVHHVPDVDAAREPFHDRADPGVRQLFDIGEVVREPRRIGVMAVRPENPGSGAAAPASAVRARNSRRFMAGRSEPFLVRKGCLRAMNAAFRRRHQVKCHLATTCAPAENHLTPRRANRFASGTCG